MYLKEIIKKNIKRLAIRIQDIKDKERYSFSIRHSRIHLWISFSGIFYFLIYSCSRWIRSRLEKCTFYASLRGIFLLSVFLTFRLTFVTFIAACVWVCQSEWVCECVNLPWKMPRSCPSSFGMFFLSFRFAFLLFFLTPLCRSSCCYCCWYCCCRSINSCFYT